MDWALGWKKTRGCWTGSILVCWYSLGTLSVSHFLSTIKVNELFCSRSGVGFIGKTLSRIWDGNIYSIFISVLMSLPKLDQLYIFGHTLRSPSFGLFVHYYIAKNVHAWNSCRIQLYMSPCSWTVRKALFLSIVLNWATLHFCFARTRTQHLVCALPCLATKQT